MFKVYVSVVIFIKKGVDGIKINEVEQLLEISKSNIRFYEKQGLLSPARTESKYREYSDADIERLKTIIILRKLGISVQDIGNILNGELALQEAIQKNITVLETQIEQLEGSLYLSRQIAREQEETLDTDTYWDIIREKEVQGEKFADVVGEYWEGFMKDRVYRHFGLSESMSNKKKAGMVILLCASYALSRYFLWKDGTLLGNFLYWPLIILFGSGLMFLIFWLGKRYPKIAFVINAFLLVICCVVLGGVVLLLVYGVIRTIWNGIFL